MVISLRASARLAPSQRWRGPWRLLPLRAAQFARDEPPADVRPGTGALDESGSNDFEAFFWRYERDILGYLWRLTGDEQAAHDLSQETFVRAWRSFAKVSGYDQPRAWLFRVASNLGLNHLRGQSRRPVAPLSSEDDLRPHADHAPRIVESDAVRQALLELPDKQRAALVLCDMYEMTCREAAETLGITQASVKTALWRGRERFRTVFLRQEQAQ